MLRTIFSLLILFNVLAWLVVYDLSQPQFFEVTFFDIGQGDAIFIETLQKHQILIDGGPDSTILERLNEEIPFWDRTIDLIILTHPEHDHYGGLIMVLERYKVKNILWTGVLRDTAEYGEWKEVLERENANVIIAKSGQRINWLKSDTDQYMEVLFPFESFKDEIVKDINNTSVIAKLIFGENSFLFTGDAYKSVERELVNRGLNVDSDILKVGHHGSKTSSDEDFIKEVSPDVAVISCGKDNPYGHPHPETLETLEKYGINILRTDLIGNIKFILNRKSYGISNFQN